MIITEKNKEKYQKRRQLFQVNQSANRNVSSVANGDGIQIDQTKEV